MARKRIKKDYIKSIGIIIFIAVGIVSALYAKEGRLFPKPDEDFTSDCYVDFIDCGQGDSTLMVSDGAVALVDATTGDEAKSVIDHLKRRGIEKIDHFFLTHPHEDHIGGAQEVLETFEVENIYMRRPTAGTEPTTSVYLNLLKTIKKQGKTVHAVEPDEMIQCGDLKIEILGPVEDYKDLNDQSIVLRAEYEKISFLITGDQEIPAEKDLLTYHGAALKSTVLKMGHHGSNTASGASFLNAVAPDYAVISCGTDNSYGHPHKESISRLEERGIAYYRTDLQGTVTFYTDGSSIKEELT